MERAFVKLALSTTLAVGAGILACSSDSAATRNPAATSLPGSTMGPKPNGGAPAAAAEEGTCKDADIDPKAAAALAKMAQFLAKAETMTFTAETSNEDVSSTLQKLQFETSIKGAIKRPNKAFLEKTGSEDVTLWFDGTTATVLDRNTNKYLSIPASDLDSLQDKLDDLDIETPFNGLLRSDIEKTVAEFAFQGDDYGSALIGGRPCEHLAFRQENVDWQLWIDSETNAPKKAVITSKLLPQAPQESLFVTQLEVNVPIDDTVFQADLPKGAEQASAKP